eukprot:2123589-Prymnesium_polylepis.1
MESSSSGGCRAQSARWRRGRDAGDATAWCEKKTAAATVCRDRLLITEWLLSCRYDTTARHYTPHSGTALTVLTPRRTGSCPRVRVP